MKSGFSHALPMPNLFVLRVAHPVHGKVAYPIMHNPQSMSLSEMWHNFGEVFLTHRCGGFGRRRGELGEGELSLLLEEPLGERMEAGLDMSGIEESGAAFQGG